MWQSRDPLRGQVVLPFRVYRNHHILQKKMSLFFLGVWGPTYPSYWRCIPAASPRKFTSGFPSGRESQGEGNDTVFQRHPCWNPRVSQGEASLLLKRTAQRVFLLVYTPLGGALLASLISLMSNHDLASYSGMEVPAPGVGIYFSSYCVPSSPFEWPVQTVEREPMPPQAEVAVDVYRFRLSKKCTVAWGHNYIDSQ